MKSISSLYLIGVKCPLPQLAERVGLVDNFLGEEELAYFSFWDNVCIIEYNIDNKCYWVKEFGIEGPHYANFGNEKELFSYMDERHIDFIHEDNPLGIIFESYSAAYLELVRWAADVAYIRNRLNILLEG